MGLYNSLDPPGPVFSGNAWGGVIIPFSGITVPDGVEQIVFRVSLDLEGIIEVYDAGTPTKDDDVMVLANDFWQRFDVTAWTK